MLGVASPWLRGVGTAVYDYAEMWVWFSEGITRSRERLLVRRSLGQGQAKVSPFRCAQRTCR